MPVIAKPPYISTSNNTNKIAQNSHKIAPQNTHVPPQKNTSRIPIPNKKAQANTPSTYKDTHQASLGILNFVAFFIAMTDN
jgi:hypothetical protein